MGAVQIARAFAAPRSNFGRCLRSVETDYLGLGARILAETALGSRLGFDVDRNELAASSIAARIAPKHTQVACFPSCHYPRDSQQVRISIRDRSPRLDRKSVV